MNTIGRMDMPEDFRYKDVFLKGRPQHSRYDAFRLRHPCMDIGHRAKIFSPFDALKGFSDAISGIDAKQREQGRRSGMPQEE